MHAKLLKPSEDNLELLTKGMHSFNNNSNSVWQTEHNVEKLLGSVQANIYSRTSIYILVAILHC